MALFIRSTPIACDARSHSCGLYQRAHRKHNWGRPKKANPTCKETTRNEIFTRAPSWGAISPLVILPAGMSYLDPHAHMGRDGKFLRYIADPDSAELDQMQGQKQKHQYINLPRGAIPAAKPCVL